MDACGLDADDQRVGDFWVRVAASDESEDVDFSRGEAEGLVERLVGRAGSRRARSSRARWASSSSLAQQRATPSRVAIACASQRDGSGRAGCARGDERLGLAPAAVGRQHRAFEVSQVCGRRTTVGLRGAAGALVLGFGKGQPAAGVGCDR